MEVKHTLAKGVLSAVAVAIAYVNHTFGVLFWVLLVLVALDLILSARKGMNAIEQVGKTGSGAIGLALPYFLQGEGTHTLFSSPYFIHAIVAVFVLHYLQVVYPQIQSLLAQFGTKHPKQETQIQSIENSLNSLQELVLQKIQEQAPNTPIEPIIPVSTSVMPVGTSPTIPVSGTGGN